MTRESVQAMRRREVNCNVHNYYTVQSHALCLSAMQNYLEIAFAIQLQWRIHQITFWESINYISTRMYLRVGICLVKNEEFKIRRVSGDKTKKV